VTSRPGTDYEPPENLTPMEPRLPACGAAAWLGRVVPEDRINIAGTVENAHYLDSVLGFSIEDEVGADSEAAKLGCQLITTTAHSRHFR